MRKSLTRSERLRATGEIRALLRSAKRIEGQGVKLLYRDNGGGANRIAVIVGRGCGGAVRRNREKRITREAYRELKPELKPGKDMVFIIGRFGQTSVQRREALRGLFKRADLS